MRGKVAVNSWEEEKVVGVVCGRRDVLGCYASYFVKEEGMNRGRMSKDTWVCARRGPLCSDKLWLISWWQRTWPCCQGRREECQELALA